MTVDADDARSVRILEDDTPTQLRHPRDVLGIVLCAAGIALMFVLAVYAHGTTQGIAEDVRDASTPIMRMLSIPVRLLELTVIIGGPIAVLGELLFGRAIRQAALSLMATLVGAAAGIAAIWAVTEFASTQMLIGLSVFQNGARIVAIPVYVASLCAMLTMAGPRMRRRTVRWTWNLLWVALALVLIGGQVTIPGVGLALLLGRIAGLAIRYAAGMKSQRAYGTALVDAVRRAGFEPTAIARVRDPEDESTVTPDLHLHSEPPTTTVAIARSATDPASRAIARQSRQRVYAMSTQDGPRLDVVVLDGDQQVIGLVESLWQSIRMRGLEGRSARSLRAVAERAALTSYAAESAGVRVPRLRGVASAGDSMLLIQEHASGAVPWRDLEQEDVSDRVLAELWRQIRRAHRHGLSHRQLTDDTILVRTDTEDRPTVWLTGWEAGVVAASELSCSLDLAQILALIALRVGPERAVRSAVLAGVDVASIGPLIQAPTLPASTRAQVRADKKVLSALREEVTAQLPDADIEPLQLTRFSARRIIMSALTVVALFVVMTSVGLDEIKDAFVQANPWWLAAAIAFGILPWIGSSVSLAAFSPVRIKFWRVFQTQVAASFVTLAAPAGIGPAVLNMRLLTTRKVTTSLAMATVSLVQVTQVVVTVAILLVIVLISGDRSALRALPSASVVATVVGVIIVVVILLLVPKVRKWVAAKTVPTLKQIWPRLSEVISQPQRILLGLAGNGAMTIGYVLTFDAVLQAFGQHVSLVDAAVVYLVGNTVGAAVPTPGGVGAIEFALVTGLTTTAGVPASIATSAVVLFRVVTYWGRIPFGWLAMQRLQRTGMV
ncbi:lysylphosphatidylglycerol synthase transmembrane domain-containing protein [Rarobacter faecitabidus]|uniref:Uncharacterized protein (TIRG00374 family) n=1 Tax=Rarobacter faecitabidus TaxID=13243 RepID=A0A542ZP59_RARFA|nr:lysylphosphatidylglycerol synthase transmembrane domain-containing protein [Rarobacter faecitabidus]TQL62148.1 uncharacterized protein (TIRG00374 family) [Rarobacter faecitabidus]